MLQFGPYTLDADNAWLAEGVRRLELAPKAFAVLCHLAARPGKLVTKDELLDAVWGHRFVSESVLKTAINAIRGVLNDDSRQPTYVETVARRGYRFIGQAPGSAPLVAPAAEPGAGPSAGAPAMPAAPPPRPEAVASTVSDVEAPAAQPEPGEGAPALVGRDEALARLTAHLQAAREGQRRIVLVAGEAGMGKSTLLQHFISRAQADGAWLASGQCIEQQGGGEPYLPLLDAIATWCRGPRAAVWIAALRRAAPTWLAQLPWLVSAEDQSLLQRELGGAAPERMLREFGALLEVLPPEARPLLVIEDLHWSDNATIGLLAYLARRATRGRWMLVASYRPTDVAVSEHPLHGLRHELRLHKLCDELVLDAFSELEVDAFIEGRLGTGAVERHAQLARALHAHTEGLPLFVATALDEMIAGGTLAPQPDGRYAVRREALQALPVPETVAGLIERRIAHLPGELRALLESASVAGAEFSHLVLADALGEPAEALQARLDGLARRGEWLRSAGMATLPDGRLAFRYAFRHVLFQRVFYERSAPAQRLQLHLRVARAVLAAHGAHAERVAAEIALHYERARDIGAAAGATLPEATQEALAWRVRAARSAALLHAPADALEHYARALESSPPPAERARIQAERAGLLLVRGDGPAALQESAAALELAQSLDDPLLLNEARVRRAEVCERCDQPQQAIALVDELLANEPTRAQRIAALVAKGSTLRSIGRMQEADAVWRDALEATPDDEPAVKARILGGMLMGHFQRATFGEGLVLARQGLQLSEQAGDKHGASVMMCRIGVFAQMLGLAAEAEVALLDARERSRELGDIDGERRALANLVKLEADRGNGKRALQWLHEAWNLADSFETPASRCALLQGFYYCHYLLGDLGAAFEAAERVMEATASLNEVYWRVGMAVLVSDLYIHFGDIAHASALMAQALDLVETHEVQHQRIKVLVRCAWLDMLRGDAAGALQRLAVARAEAEGPEDRTAADRVRAEAQLALGDARGALATLLEHDSAPVKEVWALLLALRLRARASLGEPLQHDAQLALAELADDRLPALEALLLRRTLAQTLQSGGDPAGAAEQRRLANEQRERLAATLSALPARQVAFRAQFAPLA